MTIGLDSDGLGYPPVTFSKVGTFTMKASVYDALGARTTKAVVVNVGP